MWVCLLFVDEHIFYQVSQCGVGGYRQTKTRPFMAVLVNVPFKHIDVTLVEFSQKIIFTNDLKGETMITGCIISFDRTGNQPINDLQH